MKNMRLKKIAMASTLTIVMATNSVTNVTAKKGSDEFGNYSGQSAQFKSNTSHLEYADILTELQRSRDSSQVTDLDTIFMNRVLQSSSTLPSTSEGTEQETGVTSNVGGNVAHGDVSKIVQTPGEFQGNWGGKTTEEIYNSEGYEGGGKVSQSDFEKLKGWSGQTTKFDERNEYTIPVPHYTQAGGAEEWYYYNTGNFYLGERGCHIYMVAHICTVLQGALINPAEAYILCRKYNVVISDGQFSNDEAGFNALMELNGYKCKFYYKSEIDDSVKQELINSLQNGIPCGFREGSGVLCSKGPSHFQCLDYYDPDTGEFTVAQATSSSLDKQTFSWETIYNGFYTSRPCLFIISK